MTVLAHLRDVSIWAALADPIRLQIVKRLSERDEVSGVDLAKRLGISRALLCHHSGILVEAGVCTKRKEGQTAYLRLNVTRVERCMSKLGLGASSRRRPASGARSRATSATTKRQQSR